jgi:hypothetical protein
MSNELRHEWELLVGAILLVVAMALFTFAH